MTMFDYAIIQKEKLCPKAQRGIDEYYLKTYSSMPHIDDIQHNENLDNQLIVQIVQAVRGLRNAHDFTITRLHRHFKLQLGERLIEKKCDNTGVPILKPGIFSNTSTYFPTSFKVILADKSSTETKGKGVFAIVPLEYKEIPILDTDCRLEWFNSDRVCVMNVVGATLMSLGLTNVFGISIADLPGEGKVWVERTYLKDRSHRLTLESE